MSAAFVFSLIVHGVLILGLGFTIAKPKVALPTLDVTLVNTANSQKPDKADYLAQASNRGGGTARQAHRPSQQVSSPLPLPTHGLAPQPMDPSTRKPSQASDPRLVTTTSAADFAVPSTPASPEHPDLDLPQADRDIRRRMQMARLSAEVRAETQAMAKRPRKKFISANTKAYAYATYMRAWTKRVERVGTLNFPDAARTGAAGGDLILTVGLHRDGTIKSVDVIESSGRAVLDQAAVRIVKLAAPFPPIPKTSERVDELYITRTYQFKRGGTLVTH
ncbi:energy transducer TonB [Oleiagrimonas sp. C23AA]|nr:TonB family protein [Oleiagrimonas sp. C23AA]NII11992.1 energy transducer TonB [Oleiagrimonas sp. C23AA]